MKRPIASTSSLPPPKKLASLFNKPVATDAGSSATTMHKAPRLGIPGLPGGAFQGVWGDWKGSKKIAGKLSVILALVEVVGGDMRLERLAGCCFVFLVRR